MARKTKDDTQATREGILDAAEACFHEHGVAGTTLEMIGTRAGYTRGAVYWHFENKAEVLAAIIHRVRLPFMQELDRTSSERGNTPIQDLRSVVLNSLYELNENARLRHTFEILLRHQGSRENPALLELRREGFRDGIARITKTLRRAQQLGQLRPGATPELVARMLHITVMGALQLATEVPELIDIRRDGTLALDTVLAAFVIDGVFVPGAEPDPRAATEAAARGEGAEGAEGAEGG